MSKSWRHPSGKRFDRLPAETYFEYEELHEKSLVKTSSRCCDACFSCNNSIHEGHYSYHVEETTYTCKLIGEIVDGFNVCDLFEREEGRPF